MTFSVLIASYGRGRWRALAQNRALPSAVDQGADEVIVNHEPTGTVATARNNAAAQATSEWLVFLDADDELAPGFIGAMRRASEQNDDDPPRQTPLRGELLLTPAVSYGYGRRWHEPKFWPECRFTTGNWLVIGTAVRREFFHELGGFADRPEFGAYEDYHFWARCWIAGARVEKVPDAIYKAHMEPTSRHRQSSREERLSWHYEVGKDLWPDLYDDDWMPRHSRHAAVAARRATRMRRARA